jgi:hypothetical protein
MINQTGWNLVKAHKPPNIKLQLYTIAGICMLGNYTDFVKGFITHWAYMLPSPTKQAGAIK